MASGLFKKIAKGILVGGGTILSLINPAIGAPLIVAGANIDTKTSTDIVSSYGNNLALAMNSASAMQSAGNNASIVLIVKRIIDFIKANLPIILIGGALLFLAPKLLKKSKRRR